MLRIALVAAVLTLVFSLAPPSTCTAAEGLRPRQRRAAQKAPAAQKPAQKVAQKGPAQKGRRAARASRGRLFAGRCR